MIYFPEGNNGPRNSIHMYQEVTVIGKKHYCDMKCKTGTLNFKPKIIFLTICDYNSKITKSDASQCSHQATRFHGT